MSYRTDFQYTIPLSTLRNKLLFKEIAREYLGLNVLNINGLIKEILNLSDGEKIESTNTIEGEWKDAVELERDGECLQISFKYSHPSYQEFDEFLEENEVPFDYWLSQDEDGSPLSKHYRPDTGEKITTKSYNSDYQLCLDVARIEEILGAIDNAENFRNKIKDEINLIKPKKHIQEYVLNPISDYSKIGVQHLELLKVLDTEELKSESEEFLEKIYYKVDFSDNDPRSELINPIVVALVDYDEDENIYAYAFSLMQEIHGVKHNTIYTILPDEERIIREYMAAKYPNKQK